MDPFMAEIRLFSFNMIPKGWLPCEGQLLPIAQNAALFSLLGTTYGGNGQTTFQLPDLRGRVPLHFGAALPQGSAAGEETHTLSVAEIPQHVHTAIGSAGVATLPNIAGAVWAQDANSYGPPNSLAAMSPAAIAAAGGSQAHPNMQPYLAMSFCIAVQGSYPSHG